MRKFLVVAGGLAFGILSSAFVFFSAAPTVQAQSCGLGGTCKNECSGTERHNTAVSAVCTNSFSGKCCVPTATICPVACTTGTTCGSGQEIDNTKNCGQGNVCCKQAATDNSCDVSRCQDQPCGASQAMSDVCGRACPSGKYYCVMSITVVGSGGGNQTTLFQNPLAFNTVEGLLGSVLQTLQRIIVTLALVFLVIGAILYIISGGNEARMETGKKAITAAMIGLAIGLAAPSFLREIGEVLGWGEVSSSAVAQAPTLTQIALNVLNFLLSIVGILGIIMFIIGGLFYLTAAGDEDRIDTGKKIVTYAIIGIIIAFGSLVIVKQIAAFFGT